MFSGTLEKRTTNGKDDISENNRDGVLDRGMLENDLGVSSSH